jgi:hypothetical protein
MAFDIGAHVLIADPRHKMNRFIGKVIDNTDNYKVRVPFDIGTTYDCICEENQLQGVKVKLCEKKP